MSDETTTQSRRASSFFKENTAKRTREALRELDIPRYKRAIVTKERLWGIFVDFGAIGIP